MYQSKTLAAVMILILSAGCSKNSVNPAPPSDFVSILQNGDWQMTTFNITPALNGVTDVVANMPACAKDNLLQFKANGVFYLDEGVSKCDPADLQTDKGIWAYEAITRQLTYSSPKAGDFLINVTASDAHSISGTRNVVINGVSYLFTGTLTKH